MEPISHLVKSSLPNYLSSLPVPDSLGGWFKLSFKDWLALIPPTAVLAGLGYTAYLAFCPAAQCSAKSARCNNHIRKHEAKVVDMIDVEDIAEKAAFCRCWKTKNWPYCDGSHGEHNKLTGDNVGPVVVSKKK
ncbi:CDGSH iron-sulfur domain-containing protein 2 homolog [Drosophila grimshawi]|uniref:CDGSH iron-sulfur domain-containing protein 2 homolog n=1 Tax=Drosophila grimshawi TaxID=7222 RepID=CISD2_DROGR|nr:CDGSH iron-sulfur domain-containing protein 2 homolog [Drosophila grimshawi]B4JYJ2.1 RecName: Full=CDGSH iron-sulfur domain-containing protein 2 homolog [Drosophila grimshawi]EDV90754.1 GH14305 [Drosophila grimshawi]